MARKLTKLNDIAKIPQTTYSTDAQVHRNSESGLSFAPIGAVATKTKIGQSLPVMFYNSTGTVAFIKFGDSTVAGPFTAADSLPVFPNSTAIYNSGASDWVIASTATVFVYLADYDPTN
jgi:hypothetical protein